MEKIKLEQLMKKCESPELVETYSQHIIVLDKTLEKLASVLDVIKSKIESFEFQKQILVAKKNLLDDLIEIKNFSGGFLNGDFEIDSIISELDKNIKSVEIEIEANEELNSILKHK
jgi:predicted house-cleaning noncanonical NTP pyrophosphatase (MazG superfamily)